MTRTIRDIWPAGFDRLKQLPTPEERAEILKIWRGIMMRSASDYETIKQTHPETDQIEQLEMDVIIQAYLCGYMVRRGWIEASEADQAAVLLGRDFRDQLLEKGYFEKPVKRSVARVMDGALRAVVKAAFYNDQ